MTDTGRRVSDVRKVVVVQSRQLTADVVTRIIDCTDGFSTMASTTRADEAVAALISHRPDLVVVDDVLPGTDGAALIGKMRNLAPTTRFVMLAGDSTGRALVRALQAGCNGYVHTARAAGDLVDTLRAVAAGRNRFPTDAIADLPRLDELVVHYQPVVDLESDGVVEVEALVRWNHPVAGLRSPGDFLPEAEATGLISLLGWHVLREACQQASAWRAELAEAEGLSVAVNVSVQQLAQHNAVDLVSQALEAAALPGDALVMEITESALVAFDETLAEQLRAIGALGVELRVDDFGTSTSSLVGLRRLPIGALKIDYEFVNGMLTKVGAKDIVGAIVGLAHSLGMRSVAEGVEDEQQADQLRRHGCELGQGYVWSPPLEAEAFPAWYEDHLPSGRRRAPTQEPKDTAAQSAGTSRLTYEHCGWCHFRGAYMVPGRPIVRCKYCQAHVDISTLSRSTVAKHLGDYTRNLEGRRTAERPNHQGCPECGLADR